MKKSLLPLFALSVSLLCACATVPVSSETSSATTNTSTSVSSSSVKTETSSKASTSEATSKTSTKTSTSVDTSKTSTKTSTSSTTSKTSSTTSGTTKTSEGTTTTSQGEDTFNISTSDGAFTKDGTIYRITKGGAYEISGTLSEGNIYVEASDDAEVILNLNNVNITSAVNSPIYVTGGDSLEIHSNNGYENVIIDARSAKEEDVEGQGNGAIYSKVDMKFTGKGKLDVTANYNNGIHGTKDVKIKNNTINVTARNNALKGNDSVEIESGTLKLISTGGNGIITEDSDVSSKGNQRGNITISGGNIDIYSCKDAIDAAYNVNITNAVNKDGSITEPTINIFTSNYSQYSGEVVETEDGVYYIKTQTKLSTNQRFSVYCQDADLNGEFVDAPYFTSQTESGGNRPGSRTYTYYYYKFDVPTKTETLTFYIFESSKESSLTDYVSKSNTCNINKSYDTVVLTNWNNNLMINSWTSYSTKSQDPFGPQEGNTNKASYSAKGLKADNVINVSAGNISIKAYDDGLHGNYGTSLENGETGLGDVNISGGVMSIYASDDALHADRYMNISGGQISITSSYEGVEANVINITGGDIVLYSTDDGLNAANKCGLTPNINIGGGRVDITVASGDTDGIDSNGNYTQTGGTVVSRGSSGNNRMSTGLDCDGTASVKGGTFLAFGKTEASIQTSGSVKTQTISSTFGAYTYKFTCNTTEITTTNRYSYSSCYIYSDAGNSFTYVKL